MAMETENKEIKLVSYCESRRFIIDCFIAVKVPKSHAVQMADLLVNADYSTRFKLGIIFLEEYINDILCNRIDGAAVPKIIKDTLATAWVNGQNGLGGVVGNFCMNLAIQKAKQCGIGWVNVKQSNCCCSVSHYTKLALKEGLIGIAMSNTKPMVAPTRSKEAILGINPLSVAVPAKNDKFILEMTTSVVAVIERHTRKGAPMPYGWAQDEFGNVTTDPNVASAVGCLLPLGGSEETSGYKGYGLGALVDILSGVLSGANYLTKMKPKHHLGSSSELNAGHVFIALDPSFFLIDFEERMADFNSILRSCTPIDPNNPVMIAGDKEDIQMKETEAEGGIEYTQDQLKVCEILAIKLKVKPLQFLPVLPKEEIENLDLENI